MKVGDLVEHIFARSLGLGLVTEVDAPKYSAGVLVLWATRQKPSKEVTVCLKVINESR
tara:strand:+ start:12763 stop:12936 length:174 start_codon:yes stop_codon:yes gene_type:complete